LPFDYQVYIASHTYTKEDTMGAKGAAFAREFEAKVQEAVALLEKLSDVDWKRTTAAEGWTVAAAAHHVARSYEPITGIIQALAGGQALPNFTPQMLDEMNAQHAREFASCAKPETITLFRQGAAAAAAVVRGLSDAELATSGTVFAGMPPMSAEDMVKRALLAHLDEHVGSIRKTVGG
jgi:mycothiol maleylpyruvate isomerase-like protein